MLGKTSVTHFLSVRPVLAGEHGAGKLIIHGIPPGGSRRPRRGPPLLFGIHTRRRGLGSLNRKLPTKPLVRDLGSTSGPQECFF